MIQFQAPVDILGLRRQQFVEDQAAQEQQQQLQQGIQQGIGGLIEAYVGNQRDKATAKAFGNILEMHGQTIFGENAGNLLDRYKKAPIQEQLAMGNMLMGQPGQQISRQEYLNRQAELYPRRGGSGMGGAGGGDYVVGGGWGG